MHIEVVEAENWCAVVVRGARSSESFKKVQRKIYEIVSAGYSSIVIRFDGTENLDMQSVKFLSSTADLLALKEGCLYLVRPSRHIQKQLLSNRKIRMMQNDLNQKLPLNFNFLFIEDEWSDLETL